MPRVFGIVGVSLVAFLAVLAALRFTAFGIIRFTWFFPAFSSGSRLLISALYVEWVISNLNTFKVIKNLIRHARWQIHCAIVVMKLNTTNMLAVDTGFISYSADDVARFYFVLISNR